jgi:hypothetical protein
MHQDSPRPTGALPDVCDDAHDLADRRRNLRDRAPQIGNLSLQAEQLFL